MFQLFANVNNSLAWELPQVTPSGSTGIEYLLVYRAPLLFFFLFSANEDHKHVEAHYLLKYHKQV